MDSIPRSQVFQKTAYGYPVLSGDDPCPLDRLAECKCKAIRLEPTSTSLPQELFSRPHRVFT
jgi:hypothetical protein